MLDTPIVIVAAILFFAAALGSQHRQQTQREITIVLDPEPAQQGGGCLPAILAIIAVLFVASLIGA